MTSYPANPALGIMAVTVCCSEQEAWAFLDSNQNCNASSPDYLYRGQDNRYLRRWPPVATGRLARHQFELDSIIPSDYRGFEDAVAAGTAAANPLYSDEAAILRSVLTWAAIVEHGISLPAQDHQAVLAWLNAQTQLAHRFDAVGSIGQHYGLMTGYTDASSSLAVAFWMTTRHFATGAYRPSGHSVIYRWKLATLRSTLARVNNANTWARTNEARVVDIRGIPNQIGSRPQNQSGWSLIKCELVTVLLELIKDGVIEAVVFPRTGPCPGNNLTFDLINPLNENISSVFNEIHNGQLYSQTRQRELDQFRQNNRGTLPQINLLDPQFLKWVRA